MSVLLLVDAPAATSGPGDTCTTTVTVRNNGAIVQGYDLHVLGEAAGWTRVDPPRVQLMPGQEAVAQLTFKIPAGPTTPAGALPFAVQAMGQTDPTDASVEESSLPIAGIAAGIPELRPLHGRGRNGSDHTLFVENTGNLAGTFTVWAADPDEMVDVEVKHGGLLTVAPGEIGELKLETKAMDRMLFGRANRPFKVHVTDPAGATTVIDASLDQRGLPRWIMAIPLVLAALLAFSLLHSCAKPQGDLSLGDRPTTTIATTTTLALPQITPGAPGGGGPAATTAPAAPAATAPPSPATTKAPKAPATTRAPKAKPTGPAVVIVPTTNTTVKRGPTISSAAASPGPDATGTSRVATVAGCGAESGYYSTVSLGAPDNADGTQTRVEVTLTFTPTGGPGVAYTTPLTSASWDAPSFYVSAQAAQILGTNTTTTIDGRKGRAFAVTVTAHYKAGGTTTKSAGAVIVYTSCGG